jgi:hypothetical protein
MWALGDRAGDCEGLRRRSCASTMVADIEIDQEIDGARGGSFIPFDLAHVVDDGHGAGSGDAGDFRGIGKRRREQDAGDGVVGHQLGFGDRGD